MRPPLVATPQGLPERPTSCAADGLWDLICVCLAAQPEARPTFARTIARRIGKMQSDADSARADWLRSS